MSAAIHAAYSLLTLEPGRPGGSETNARAVLAEFSCGVAGLATTVLATSRVRRDYQVFSSEHVAFASISGYPGAQSAVRRFSAVALNSVWGALATEVLSGPIDVIHYPLTVPVPRMKIPRVVTLFDVNYHDLPEMWSRAQRVYRRSVYDSSARDAEIVVTASRHSAGRIVDTLGLSAERIRVIPLGIDHAVFNSVPTPTDAELAVHASLPERFVLYPAALLPHKNHERLLSALALVEDKEISLILTGQTYRAWPRLHSLAVRLGIADRVRHLGLVDVRLLAAMYRQAAAVVFPSLYEGFGAPTLEAMACGTPLAASMATSLMELCDGAAVPMDPRDVSSIASAVDAVLADSELRGRLTKAGRERAASFSWRRAAEQHVLAYRAAIAGGRG